MIDIASLEAFLITLMTTPAVASIIANIVSHLKNKAYIKKNVTDKFESVRQEVIDTKNYKELKSELALAHQENRELKKLIRELLTKIDRIDRSNEE
jgi:hypothetical protein